VLSELYGGSNDDDNDDNDNCRVTCTCRIGLWALEVTIDQYL
jgi:hypothetical protein